LIKNEQQQRPRDGGLANLAWTVYGIWSIGVAAAIFMFFVGKGFELLALPDWAWVAAAVELAGTATFSAILSKRGALTPVMPFLKVAGIILFAVLPVASLVGFDGSTEHIQQTPGTFGFDAEQMFHLVAHGAAWISLLGAPVIAAIATGCAVLATQRLTSAGARSN
jgi:hypothetical protein